MIKKYFDFFIGIDWSGAKGSSHKGISVAISSRNSNTIKIIDPKNNFWSRQEVFEYLINLSSQKKIFVGIDFAFSYPYLDLNSFFPNLNKGSPKTAKTLWALIESINQEYEDFYGGGIWNDETYGDYYNSPVKKGKFFKSRRRLTELVAKKVRSPSPTFNCVGPAGVGTGTLAGMRFINQIKKNLKEKCHIWPFDQLENLKLSNIVIAEIFPSFYFHYAGQNSMNKRGRELELLSQTLRFYNHNFQSNLILGRNDNDDMDAIVSCAALKYFVDRQAGLTYPFNSKEIFDASKFEGWILGVN